MERLQFASEDSVKFLKLWKELQAHYQELAVSHDNEMLEMIDLVDATRIEWSKSASECNRLTSLNESLQRENGNLTTELRNTQDLHLEAQAQIKLLHTTIQGLQHNVAEYEKRFHDVKKILREQNAKFAADINIDKLMAFSLPGSPRSNRASSTTIEEIDYDRTGDSEQFDEENSNNNYSFGRTKCRAAKKRPSSSQQPFRSVVPNDDEEGASSNAERDAPQTPPPSKRSRLQCVGGAKTCVVPQQKKSSIRRSISESNLLYTPKSALASPDVLTRDTLNLQTPRSANRDSTWTRGRRIAECGHTLKVVRCFQMGCCAVCRSFARNQCIDCNCYIHEKCISRAPMPCVPPVAFKRGQSRLRLADICTEKCPNLPPSIVHCVETLERINVNAAGLEECFLATSGLYRINGCVSAVHRLFNAVQSNTWSSLEEYDPEAICGCMKLILSRLQDPLIPNSSYREFARAADEKNHEQMMTAISELPLPNRYTLAYLCLHWKNVSRYSEFNQMDIKNLAICLSPTVCGDINPQQYDVKAEALRQNNLLLQLLLLDQDYWAQVLYSPPVKDCFGSTRRAVITPARRPLAEMNADRSTPVTCTEPLIRPITPHTADCFKFD